MKRIFFVVLIVLGMLVASTGIALAGSAIELKLVRNDVAGPTFIFRVSGTFTNDELNSFVKVQGGDHVPLYCRQIEDDTVICHAARTIGGKNVTIYFGGAKFWVKVPEQSLPKYCYNAYDWWGFTGNMWVNFGPLCQNGPAEPFDTATYSYSIGGTTYGGWVQFYDFDAWSSCPTPAPYTGPAYYYPGCPP
ncbi:MAG: hypothetical protein LC099_07480 [Anaerolineales bacterium]|nr:hypothetical protein [Anaerolineales bacterium]